MGDFIIVGVELTESEDSALRIEAAKAGMSKRKFAREIIVNWLRENHIKSIKEIYNDILQGIINHAAGERRNYLLDTLMALSDNCAELVKLIIKMESAKSENDEELKIKISKKIESSLKTINDFCQTFQITPFPNKPAEVFAFEFINEYRPG